MKIWAIRMKKRGLFGALFFCTKSSAKEKLENSPGLKKSCIVVPVEVAEIKRTKNTP